MHDLAAEGRTVVLVLPDLSTVCRHADHLVAMRAGRVVAEGRPADVVTPQLVADLYGVEAARSGDRNARRLSGPPLEDGGAGEDRA